MANRCWRDIPVGASLGIALQVNGRLGEIQHRDLYAMRQQRQRCDTKVHGFQSRENRLAGPVGVGHANVLRHELRPRHPALHAAGTRLALPVHAQVAIDGERPADGLTDLRIDPGLEPVPVERGNDDPNHHDQCQPDADDP